MLFPLHASEWLFVSTGTDRAELRELHNRLCGLGINPYSEDELHHRLFGRACRQPVVPVMRQPV
jgi:hypothetical protein